LFLALRRFTYRLLASASNFLACSALHPKSLCLSLSNSSESISNVSLVEGTIILIVRFMKFFPDVEVSVRLAQSNPIAVLMKLACHGKTPHAIK
jgi:hypothetical protein